MTDVITALFAESAKNPLATFIVIVLLVLVFIFFVFIYPKIHREKMAAQAAMTAQLARGNEVINHSSAVINNNSRALDNNSKAMDNNSQAMELTRQAVGDLCGRMNHLQDRFEAHDGNMVEVLKVCTETNAFVRK